MSRAATVVIALLLAVATPAKAWCEVSCQAPTHATKHAASSRCPAHESSNGPSIAAHKSECPVVEMSRPAVAKLHAIAATAATPQPRLSMPAAPSVRAHHPDVPAPPHLRSAPLRI